MRNLHFSAHNWPRLLRLMLSVLIAAAVLWLLPGTIFGLGDLQPVAAASDPVIAAAGDIACDPTNALFQSGNGTPSACRQKYTYNLLAALKPAAILALGDNQYACGGFQAFVQSYDLSWGKLKSITHPVAGNHEYLTSGGTDCTPGNAGAAGYFDYFGAAAGTPGAGYYSFDVGTWHLIALNSNCADAGGCTPGSPQYNWLQNDLATHSNYCTLAFWHIPLYSSGGRAAPNTQPFWTLLYNYGADLVLSGHDHLYERFAPQNSLGAADSSRGLREFIVGTGGADHTGVASVAPNSQIRNATTFGVLKLVLHPASYAWQFLPESGQTFSDSGSGHCHGLPVPTATPTTFQSTPTSTLQPTATNTPGPAPSSTPTSTPTPVAGQLLTFLPDADSYVNSSNPASNYGSATSLRADGSPDVHSYLRFTVAGLGGKPIVQVRLRLFMNSAATAGLKSLAVSDNSWVESAVTYNNAPALGGTLATTGALTTGTWATLDVTSYVTGQGTFSFGVTTPGSTAVSFASKESGANAPQLIVTIGP